jgi:hypothetical protein
MKTDPTRTPVPETMPTWVTVNYVYADKVCTTASGSTYYEVAGSDRFRPRDVPAIDQIVPNPQRGDAWWQVVNIEWARSGASVTLFVADSVPPGPAVHIEPLRHQVSVYPLTDGRCRYAHVLIIRKTQDRYVVADISDAGSAQQWVNRSGQWQYPADGDDRKAEFFHTWEVAVRLATVKAREAATAFEAALESRADLDR